MGKILEALDEIRNEWTPGSIDPREGALLYWMIRNQQPHRLIEIGRSTGYSTLWLAAAVQDNGVGAIVSFDPVSEEKCEQQWLERAKKFGADKFVNTSRLASVDAAQHWLWDERGFHGFYEFLFLDGDHTPQAVEDDLLAWLPHMAPHGTMVMHDTIKFMEDEIAVKVRDRHVEYFERAWPGQIVRRLAENEHWGEFTFTTLESSHGLTLIRRKGSL